MLSKNLLRTDQRLKNLTLGARQVLLRTAVSILLDEADAATKAPKVPSKRKRGDLADGDCAAAPDGEGAPQSRIKKANRESLLTKSPVTLYEALTPLFSKKMRKE